MTPDGAARVIYQDINDDITEMYPKPPWHRGEATPGMTAVASA